MFMRGFYLFVFFVTTTIAQAAVPDLAVDLEMRAQVCTALASPHTLSSFQSGEQTHAVLKSGWLTPSPSHTLTEIAQLALQHGLFERQGQPIESDGNILQDYRVSFDEAYAIQPMTFELITFHVDANEDADGGGAQILVPQKDLKRKLLIQVQALRKQFEKENPELAEIKQVTNVMHHFRFNHGTGDAESSVLFELSMLLKNLEGTLKRRFEEQLAAMGVSVPASVQLERYLFLRYVKTRILPTAYRDLDDELYLQVFEEIERLAPKPVRSQVVSAERQSSEVVCTQWGGAVAKYRIAGEEVLLCRFGAAGGIGAGTLERFVHSGMRSKAIEVLLNPIDRDESRAKAFSVQWSVDAQGKVKPQVVSEEAAAQDSEVGEGDWARPRFWIKLTPRVIHSRHCRSAGGRAVLMTDLADLTQHVGCEFADESGMLGATLFDGPGHEANAQLVSVLQQIEAARH